MKTGLATMSPEKRLEAQRKGGQAKVPKGFAKNRELARIAGRRGGEAKARAKR